VKRAISVYFGILELRYVTCWRSFIAMKMKYVVRTFSF